MYSGFNSGSSSASSYCVAIRSIASDLSLRPYFALRIFKTLFE